MKKIIVISSVLLGVVFLAGCSLRPVSQKPSATSTALSQQSEQPAATDETANWLTYTNPTFGYSIKYPATWTEKQSEQSGRPNVAIEFNNGDSLMLRIVTYKISDRQAFVGALTNGQYKGDSNLLSIISGGTDQNNNNPNIIAYKIGNLDGYRRLATSSIGDINNGFKISSVFTYMAQDSKYIYEYKTILTNKNVESPEIVKMLKTFTTQKTDETANWETYTNDKYGFEVKHPTELGGSFKDGIVVIRAVDKNKISYGMNVETVGLANSASASTSAENWYPGYYRTEKQESVKYDRKFFLSENGQNVQLNGYTAFKTLDSGSADSGIDHDVVNFYIYNDKAIYVLTTYNFESANDKKWEEQEKIILQMLTTFKFTK